MKKSLGLALLLFLPGFALGADGDLPADQRWVETGDFGLSLPGSAGASKAFNTGFGGDVSVGYRLDHTFTFSVASGYFQYDISNPPAGITGNFSYVPLMGVLRVNLSQEAVRPYLLLGLGVAFNSSSTSSGGKTLDNYGTQTDFLASPGVGVLFRVSDNTALFVQGRLDLDFTPAHGFGGTDSPTLFVPLQGGIGFFVI